MELTAKEIAGCLKINYAKNRSTMIHGAPGIGKSQVVTQVAEELEIDLVDIRLNLRESVDLRGLPLVDAKSGTTKWLPPDELPTKGKGILFLDEINAGTSMSLQATAMQLILERKLGEYRLPKGWVPVAAGNRVIDKSAAQRMGRALANRFSHFEMKCDVEAWCAWANRNNISPMVIAFIRFKPDLLHKMPDNDIHAWPSPRTWEFANDYVDAPDSVRLQLIGSVVGDGPAFEFEGFCQTFKNLPSIDMILLKPKEAPIPDAHEPSVMWAISQALARKCTEKTFKNAMIYMQRLSKEHEVSMVIDAVNRDRNLINTRAYGDWCISNQEVIVG